MSAQHTNKSIRQRAWIVIRFVLFGIGGFWAMVGFTVAFALRVLVQEQRMMSPWFSLPLACVGALMMLYGVGEWGRWAYLWVFLSIPISLCLLTVIPGAGSSKELPVIVAAAAAFVSYGAVRAYYGRQREEAHEHDNAA